VNPLLTVAAALYLLNAALFGFLAYVYGKTAVSTRARYPLGLFIFAVLLIVQTAGTALTYLVFGYEIGGDAVPSMFAMASFEFVGVLALLKTTL
jgi:hypothetical protein